MTIDAIHEHGIVRRHRIDPLVVWQRLSGPQSVIPVPSQDPFTGPQGSGVLFDSPYELGGGGGVPKVDRRELEAAVDEMSVPVGEPGPHHASADDEIRLVPAGGEEKAQHSREKASAHRSLNEVW